MKSKIKLSIVGKSPNRFILRLKKNNINFYRINKLSKEKYEVIIKYEDYEKLLNLNTIYEINVLDYLGMVKNRKSFFNYIHVTIIGIISIIVIFIFSNIIFNVEIISNDEELKKRLYATLKQYDVCKYRFKKEYKYLTKVKKEILEKYSDTIEWIEVEKKGTNYIIKIEPKVNKEKIKTSNNRHIVAKKNAIIRKIFSNSGQVIKNKYSYVKKGDIIISGFIYNNDEIVDTISAEGKVFGEVWYETKVIYPFNYYEETKTGKSKKIFNVKLFNKNVELFNFSPFNDKIVEEDIVIKHNFLPLSLVLQRQDEIIVKTEMNTLELLKEKAISLAYSKMNDGLKENEYIIDYRVLNSKIIDKGIEMIIFFSVNEEISDYVEIDEERSEVDEKRND